MSKLKITFIAFFAMLGHFAFSQTITVSGVVSDESGMPLPGASVVVSGTTNGTQTDFDGNYTISNVPSDGTLTISYIGYVRQQVAVNGQTSINVSLVEDTQALDEVVVVAYGSQSRAAVTGAISSVGAEEISALPVATADQALQGRAAGVTVTNNGGPGTAPSVRIRGLGSPTGGNPLVVIDGVISTGLGAINPNDIESINILKDAATTAAYGSQAANGVVVVTTKKGKAGRTEFNFNTYTGMQFVTQRFDVLNTSQYLNFIEEAFGTVPSSPLSSSGINTNWQDEIFQTGILQNYDVGMAGGNERSDYRASIGMLKQEGTIIETGFNRYNIRLNSNFDVTNNFKVGQTLAVALSDQKPEASAGGRTLLEHAIKAAPYLPVYNPNNLGGYQGPTSSLDGQDAENPVRIQEHGSRLNRATSIFGSVYGEYEFLTGLKFRSQFGLEYNHNTTDNFIPSFDDDSNGQSTHSQPFAAITKNRSIFRRFLYTNSLNYNFTIGDGHNFDLLALVEKNEALFEALNTSSQNTVTDEIEQHGPDQVVATSNEDAIDKIGYLGRLNYNFNDKYLFSASIRRDGSSVFGPNTKWGTFPSVSAGWNIAKENFMSETDLNTLKLRGSWGITGFDGIPNYRFGTTLNPNWIYVVNGTAVGGTSPAGLPNPDVAWEEKEMLNIGLDFGVFDNRLTGAIEYYNNKSNQLLINVPITNSLGSLSPTVPTNIGDAETKGFEFTLGYNDFDGDFTWSTNLNVSTAKSVLLNQGVDGRTTVTTFEGSIVNGLEVDAPLYAFYGYQTNGIYQTQAEVNAALGTEQTSIQPGDIRFVDQNGDSVIDDEDIVRLGQPTPEIIYGLNLDANYKSWDFNAFINGAAGHEIYNTNIYDLQGMPRTFNAGVAVLDRWTPTNPSNTVPRAFDGNNGINTASSDRYIENGSYTRLKNVTIGYTIGEDSQLSEYFTKLRLYVSGQNLLTLTDYSGLDPEIGTAQTVGPAANGGNPATGYGIDLGNYPQPKSVIVGLQLTF